MQRMEIIKPKLEKLYQQKNNLLKVILRVFYFFIFYLKKLIFKKTNRNN